MIATVHTGGTSFKGVVDYCLSEGRAREDERDELRGEDRGQDKAGRGGVERDTERGGGGPATGSAGDGGHRLAVGGSEAVGGGEGRGPGSGEAGVPLLAELGGG